MFTWRRARGGVWFCALSRGVKISNDGRDVRRVGFAREICVRNVKYGRNWVIGAFVGTRYAEIV